MNLENWQERNSQYLTTAVKWLRLRLERMARLNGAMPSAPPPSQPAEPPAPVASEHVNTSARASRRLRWLGRASGPVTAVIDSPPAMPLLLSTPGIESQLKDAADARAEAERMEPPPALSILALQLGLSEFERDLLLLCVALELDTSIEHWCASAQNDKARPYPTFALALSLFDSPSWDALAPHRPLRYWRLLEVNQPAATPLTASPLRADERIVSYVKGLNTLDERLATLFSHVESPLAASHTDAPLLAPSQQASVQSILRHWLYTPANATVPIAELSGTDSASKRLVAVAVAAALQRQLFSVSAEALSAQSSELELLTRLWQREALLLPLALYIDAHDAAPPERFIAAAGRSNGLILLGVRDPLPNVGDASFTVDVSKPTTAEQEAAWHTALAGTDADTRADDTTTRADNPTGDSHAAAPDDAPDDAPVEPDYAGQLASQFSFNLPDIYTIGESAKAVAQASRDESRGADETNETKGTGETEATGETKVTGETGSAERLDVWELCKARTRQRLDVLAERLEPKATWDDIVLMEEPLRLLRAVADQVRRRNTVYEQWGFARKMNRGFGISALFAGESGTGKTMAAEVIANDLRLNLYRIDLSAVVSKYIGETEKNLRRLFDAAESGGTILFFDEADALFGKRSEVKDSHDRYANIEINYLLQRMEGYGGLAILATNMKGALDQAFMRRLRFVVNFSFPSVAERKQMWEKAFPPEVPKEKLDYERMARFSLTGGNIHSIALNAAFLAAQANSPVTMPLVMAATRMEFRKLDRALNESDFRV
jgi:ATPase family associated with various cellular activities (AAA)